MKARPRLRPQAPFKCGVRSIPRRWTNGDTMRSSSRRYARGWRERSRKRNWRKARCGRFLSMPWFIAKVPNNSQPADPAAQYSISVATSLTGQTRRHPSCRSRGWALERTRRYCSPGPHRYHDGGGSGWISLGHEDEVAWAGGYHAVGADGGGARKEGRQNGSGTTSAPISNVRIAARLGWVDPRPTETEESVASP